MSAKFKPDDISQDNKIKDLKRQLKEAQDLAEEAVSKSNFEEAKKYLKASKELASQLIRLTEYLASENDDLKREMTAMKERTLKLECELKCCVEQQKVTEGLHRVQKDDFQRQIDDINRKLAAKSGKTAKPLGSLSMAILSVNNCVSAPILDKPI